MGGILLALGRVLTPGRRFIAQVDGLRFVAITSVVLYHLRTLTLDRHMGGAVIQPVESWLPKALDIGRYGVQLFFVLSGFLLAMPFAKWRLGLAAKPSLRNYYFRRLTRLEPPYLIALLLFFIAKIVVYEAQVGLSLWPNLLASVVYQHNLLFGALSPISTVIWTLELEVQFYIVAPLFALVFSICNVVTRRTLLLAIIVVSPLARSFIPYYFSVRFNSLPWYFEFFATGFLLADVYLVDWKERPQPSFVWDLCSLAGWPALAALLLSNRLHVLIAPAIFITYVGAFRGKVSSRIFCYPLLTVIGGMCYSMYLLHGGVIWMTGELSRRVLVGSTFTARFALDCLCALPAVLIATGWFFLLVERPCMEPTWPSRFAAQSRQWLYRVTKKVIYSRPRSASRGRL